MFGFCLRIRFVVCRVKSIGLWCRVSVCFGSLFFILVMVIWVVLLCWLVGICLGFFCFLVGRKWRDYLGFVFLVVFCLIIMFIVLCRSGMFILFFYFIFFMVGRIFLLL